MAEVALFVAAVATYSAGRKAAQAQAKQAAFELQRSRQAYLQSRQEGISVLDEMLQNAASVNAYAGAGGIDASSGSVDRIATFNLSRGVADLITSEETGQFALRAGTLQSKQLMQQAKATRINAFAQSAAMIAAGADAAKATGTGGGT